MASGHLGNYASVTSIDTPKTDIEKIYAKWYDTCLDMCLKLAMPNFALARETVAQDSGTPDFGYSFQYAKPSSCLKVLGVGNALDKMNDYAVEGDFILSDTDYTDGMPVRYVKRITTVSKYTPDFVLLLSQFLAAYACLEITQDVAKAKKLKDELPTEISVSSGMSAQENVPVRVSRSRFKGARYSTDPDYTNKK